MITDKTRELNLKAKLFILYNPEDPIAEGYYSSNSTVKDPENLNPVNRNFKQSSYVILSGQKYNKSNSLFKTIPSLNNGHIPPVNTGIGSPRCTFAFGSIVPGEKHPIYDLLTGPKLDGPYQYNPNFVGNEIKVSQSGTGASIGSTAKIIDKKTPVIPYSSLNLFGAKNVLNTYNIWALCDDKLNLLTYDCQKYGGQNIDYKKYPNAPILQTKGDINGESSIYFASPKSVSYIYRVFPLIYDTVFEKDAYVYAAKNYYENGRGVGQIPYVKKVVEQANRNQSFHLTIYPSFDNNTQSGQQSQITVRIGYVGTSNQVAYQLNISQDQSKFYVINPKNEFLEQQFNVTLDMSEAKQKIDLYMHFLEDFVLVGFNPDPSTWNNIFPIAINKYTTNDHYIHGLNSDATIVIECAYASCDIQYEPLCFNNFNTDENTTVIEPYVTFSTKNPNATYSLSPYKGYKQKLTNGVSNYNDARGDSHQIDYIGVKKDENSDMNFAQVKFNSVIGGPIFTKLENSLNSNDDIKYTLAPNNNLLYPIASGQKDSLKPLYANDISEYLTEWTISYDHNTSNLIFSTAEVTFKNLDAASSMLNERYSGMNILSLIEKNMIVLELSAGYGDELNVFFQGFIKNTRTTRSASESVTVFGCEDVGKTILSTTVFKNFVLFAGAKMKYSIQRCFEHSGFYRYFKLNDNPGYYNSIHASMSFTQLEQKQVQCSEGEPVIDKLKTFLDEYMTKQSEMPYLRFDYNTQFFEMDWRYDPKYQDVLKLFGVNVASREKAFDENLTDWHGLLSGPFTVSTDNGRFYKYFEARGFGYEGFIPATFTQNQDNGFKRILDGDFSVNGYVGYEKSFYKSLGNLFPDSLSVKTWLTRFRDIHLKPLYTLSFTCYITRPLNVHGSFFVKSVWENKTRQTDAYLYTNVTYKCDKANNLLTATVTGNQSTKTE